MLIFISTIEDNVIRSKLETIYELFSKAMYDRAFRVLNNASDADDAVQEAFIRLFKNEKSIKDPGSSETKSFALVIVGNCAIDIYRKRKRLNETELSEEDFIIDDCIEYDGENPISAEVMKLNPRYRDALILKYVYELDYNEIASCLNISVVNSRKLVQRAKDRLENICKEKGLL
ncbi:MAG: RNA polymerase sigma factor [Lachnospiraceae bacterium]|nr:RNA polymerase sigma factor [Lachnospiraceae bacterium]